MKQRLSMTLLCCVMLLGLAGCRPQQSKPPVDSNQPITGPMPTENSTQPQQSGEPGRTEPPEGQIDPEVGNVFYSERQIEGSDGVAFRATDSIVCHWNVLTGEMIFEDKPALTVADYLVRPFVMWDGEYQVSTSARYDIIEQDPSYSIRQEGGRHPDVLRGDDWEFTIEDGIGMLRLETGETLTFQDKEGPEFEGNYLTLENSQKNILAGGYEEGVLTIAYFYRASDPHESRIAYVKLDGNDGSVRWSELIRPAPESIHGLLRFPEAEVSALVDDQLYYPGELAVGFLNLETGETRALTEITAALDGLIPDSVRRNSYGMYSYLLGCNRDIAVGAIFYDSSDGELSYVVAYAICNGELLGAYCRIEAGVGSNDFYKIITYDADLTPLHTYTPEDTGFSTLTGSSAERHYSVW